MRPIHGRLSKSTKHIIGALWFGRFQHDKQNKESTFINIYNSGMCYWPKSELIIIIVVDFFEVFIKVPITKMWHVSVKIKKPLTQVWTEPWQKNSIVNKPILTFNLISSDKSYSKFHLSPMLGLKIYEITSNKSSTHQGLSNGTKSMPLYPLKIIVFCNFVEFSSTKMVQSAMTVHHMPKHYQTT